MNTFRRPIRIVRPSPMSVALLLVIAGSMSAGGILSAGQGGPPLVRSHGPIVDTEKDPGTSPEGTLSWKVPPTWKSTPPTNAMRKAQYTLPAAAGDPSEAECVVFYFGAGQGGDVQGNIDRWRSMFSSPDGSPAPSKVGEMKVGSRVISKVETVGTYQPTSMGMGGPLPEPKPGWMLLGAVVPGSEANWFFRCAGPKKTIEAQRANFDTLLASIK
jgi:hypothetical protein